MRNLFGIATNCENKKVKKATKTRIHHTNPSKVVALQDVTVKKKFASSNLLSVPREQTYNHIPTIISTVVKALPNSNGDRQGAIISQNPVSFDHRSKKSPPTLS